MEQTWRWFGPQDKVNLTDAKQAGAQGIVTALHHVPGGEVWSVDDINSTKAAVEAAGMRWSTVESLDVTESIKTRSGDYRRHTENFIQSLSNLAACGIKTVAYNLMPVFSWMRTTLHLPLESGAYTTAFQATHFAAFDLFLLRRKDAEKNWSATQQAEAAKFFSSLSLSEQEILQQTILQGLPGGNGRFTLQKVKSLLETYQDIDTDSYRSNVSAFLREVCPVAEELGVRLCLHPDDPPRPLLGLPRIASTASDLAWILEQSPEESNGLTFCTGALGVRADNDLTAMVKQFAHRIGFAHLRSTQRYVDRGAELDLSMDSFFEACHLEGDADLIGVVVELVREERRRKATGDEHPLPFRSDHGQELLDDVTRGALPGYPAVGRLRGLAELRGAMLMAERLLPEWTEK